MKTCELNILMDRFTLFPPIVYRSSSSSTLRPPLILRSGTENATVKGHPDDFLLITAANTSNNVVNQPKFNSEGWSIALVVLTSVRLLIVLSLWIYLTKRILSSKVALTRVWHSQLLLASLSSSHVVLFAFVFTPTPFSCGLIRIGVGLSYALPYALLLLKLIIIASNYRGYELPQFYQGLLLSCLVGIQIAISSQWLSLIPVDVVIQNNTCGISVGEWLRHLVYVILLMLTGTVMAVTTRQIKSNHRDSMFLGLALGLNIPIWFIWSIVGTLVKGKPGFNDQCLAFGLYITTSIILFVMFLPRSRQLEVVGENGLYTEDSASVSKPISELTVHKLYYPVYGERRLSTSVTGGTAADQQPSSDHSNFRLSTHWYPPIRDLEPTLSASSSQSVSKQPNRMSRPYHFDDMVCTHHNRHQNRCQMNPGQSNSRRCLTPPSEEEGSTTSSSSRPTNKRKADVEKPHIADEEEDDTDLDMDIGKYKERNSDTGIMSYSQVVAQQQPMY